MAATFSYGFARVRDFNVKTAEDETSRKSHVTSLTVNDEEFQPTPRFWTSFFMRFGVSDTIFRYFDHAEVFERVSERAKDDRVRLCVERDEKGNGKLMAVSNPERPVITHDEAMHLVNRYDGHDVTYDKGIVTSTHIPRSGHGVVNIGGDEFKHRYMLDTPIDGYSQPKIHLSFLRLLCTNGMVGYTKAFRSELNVGKDPAYCIARALESYDNDDGYGALRQRFQSAQNSWASIHECEQLYKSVARLKGSKSIKDDRIVNRFHQMTGNIHELYGLANVNALSVKRQRVLPARCKVYDLLNFASETATHHATPEGAKGMQAYLGGLIADEFDMEGTAEQTDDFQDFFMDSGDSPVAPSRN
ncbi:MAG: hypothetical protein N2C14_30785 [Planctomycetales bacterium]